MLVEYEKKDSFLHRLDPRVIVFYVFVVAVTSVVWTNPLYCLAVFIAAILIGFLGRFPWREMSWFFKLLMIPVVLITLIQGATGDPGLVRMPEEEATRVLFYLIPGFIPGIGPAIAIKAGGFLYGLAAVLKIYMVVVAVAVMGYVVSPTDLIHLLSRVRFMPRSIIFIISTAWRFIPLVHSQVRSLLEAQKTRGAEIEKGSITGRVKNLIPVVTPLLSNALEIGDTMALAMEARAFGASKKITYLKPFKFKKVDFLVFSLLLLVLAVIIALAVMGYGIL